MGALHDSLARKFRISVRKMYKSLSMVPKLGWERSKGSKGLIGKK